MLNNKGTECKYAAIVPLDGTTGIKGSVDGQSCFAETQIRAEVAGVGVTNTVQIQGRLRGSTTWTTLKTITGATSDTVDISTHDFVRYNVGVADGTGTVVASGFFFKLNAGGAGGTLASLTDVDVDPLADQDILRYESATSKWTAQAADYASRTGDSLTGEYGITNNSGVSPPLIMQNLDPDGAASTVYVNDDSSGTLTVGVLGSNYSGASPVQPGVGIVSASTDLLVDAGVNIIFTKVGVEVASINAAGKFTSTTIDPLPVAILDAPADVAADSRSSILYTDFTTGLNKRTKLEELPTSNPTLALFTNMNSPLYVNTAVSAIVTGTLTETIVASFLIPANTLSAFDIIRFKTLLFRNVGIVGSKVFALKGNTINSLTGAYSIGSSSAPSSSLTFSWERTTVIDSGNLLSANISGLSDVTSSTATFISNSFNVAVDNYIFITARVSNIADSTQLIAAQVDRK
jgi:hypothetical protein